MTVEDPRRQGCGSQEPARQGSGGCHRGPDAHGRRLSGPPREDRGQWRHHRHALNARRPSPARVVTPDGAALTSSDICRPRRSRETWAATARGRALHGGSCALAPGAWITPGNRTGTTREPAPQPRCKPILSAQVASWRGAYRAQFCAPPCCLARPNPPRVHCGDRVPARSLRRSERQTSGRSCSPGIMALFRLGSIPAGWRQPANAKYCIGRPARTR